MATQGDRAVRVFLLDDHDDHEVVRQGVASLLGLAEQIVKHAAAGLLARA